jgi:lipopolysaccharide transport system permease protein
MGRGASGVQAGRDGDIDVDLPQAEAAVPQVSSPSPERTVVIRPATRLPRLDVGELWHYRELLWTLVWRDVAVRYKQTFLGVAWAILVPAFTALVYVIVFGKFANFPAGSTPYPSLVVAGVLPMQYFASALSLASLSLLDNLPLVTMV